MILQKNLYSDLNFFISKNPFTNDFAIRKDQNAINQSIKNIVLTNFGERPFLRNFGSNIYNSVFEHPELIAFYVDEALRLAINTFEPRINIIDIEYNTTDNIFNVQISYSITSLNITGTFNIEIARSR
jgi:phage baseplate assembly protein W